MSTVIEKFVKGKKRVDDGVIVVGSAKARWNDVDLSRRQHGTLWAWDCAPHSLVDQGPEPTGKGRGENLDE